MAVFDHVASNASQTAVASLAFTTNPTAGNSLVVCISWTGSQSTPTCASSNGNTYVLAKLELDATHNYGAAVFVAHNCVGGAETVTPSETSVSNFDIVLAEYAKGTNVLQTDKTASDHQTSADPNSGNTAVTSAAAELVFGFVAAAASTPTAGTGFTGRVTGGGVFNTIIEDKVVSSTGVQAAAFTAGSQNWLCVCVTLMETPAGGGSIGPLFASRLDGLGSSVRGNRA